MKYNLSHSILCNANVIEVYEVFHKIEKWPIYFTPCQKVKILIEKDNFRRIEISALVNGEEKTWISEQIIFSSIFGINTVIIKPMPGVQEMNVFWRAIKITSEVSLLLLEHEYNLIDNNKIEDTTIFSFDNVENYVKTAIDNNSNTELMDIKNIAEKKMEVNKGSCVHSIICNSNIDSIYDLICDTKKWIGIFPSCINSEVLELRDNEEIVKITVLQNLKEISWVTKRNYISDIYKINYELLNPMPFMHDMRGSWRVIPISKDKCILSVERHWIISNNFDNYPDKVSSLDEANEFVKSFVDNNSISEMEIIKAYVEDKQIPIYFSSFYRVNGNINRLYEYLANINLWNQLEHCESIEVIYEDDSYQEFIMNVKGLNGTEFIRSVRNLNRENYSITYFQPLPPSILGMHHGGWKIIEEDNNKLKVKIWHKITIKENTLNEIGVIDKITRQEKIIKTILNNTKKTIDRFINL